MTKSNKTETETAVAAPATSAVAALRKQLSAVREAAREIIPESGGGRAFLRLDQATGRWVWGRDHEPVPDGVRFAVNPMGIELGFVSFGGAGKPPIRVARGIAAPPVSADELPPRGPGYKEWQGLISLPGALVMLDADDQPAVAPIAQVAYEATNVGGLSAAGGVFDAIVERVEAGEDAVIPLVRLGVDSYIHREHGNRIHVPVMEITGWLTLDELDDLAKVA